MIVRDQDHAIGPDSAPITIIEYGDYISLDCKEAHRTVMAILDSKPNSIRLVYRHFAHDRVNREGFVAAMAAEAAAEQGSFWELHSKFMQAKDAITSSDIVRIAEEIGLDMPRFLRDISHSSFNSKIRGDLESGAVNGVQVVPTFFLNGNRMPSTFSSENLIRALNSCY